MDNKEHQLSFDFISKRELAYEELYGKVNSIFYENPNTGWKVITVINDDNTEKKAAGFLPNIHLNDNIHARGTNMEHPKFGDCLQIDEFYKELPFHKEGVMRYMISMIDGVGEHTAEHIVDRFRDQTLNILENEPDRLLEIEGISNNLLEKIKTSTEKIDSAVKELVLLGFSPKWAGRIYLKYGKEASDKVKNSPYRLIDDFKGIGFKKAETIAVKTGIDKIDDERIHAAIMFSLKSALKKTGHNFLYLRELTKLVSKLLDLPRAYIESEIITHKKLIIEDDRIYLPSYYHAERKIALYVSEKSSLEILDGIVLTEKLKEIEDGISLKFSDDQKVAIETAVRSPITVITGAAGTGKTTVCLGILKLLDKLGMTYRLCAPTGKAANKLNSVTGYKAFTIHRLFEYAPAVGYRVNKENPLAIDYLIIDEASMIDLLLLKAVFEGIKKETRIVFIGDHHQLPPVEAGNSLQALLGSYSIAQISLPLVFRQQQGSTILKNAGLINLEKGIDTTETDDFIFYDTDRPIEMIERLYHSIELLKSEGYHPLKDINILTPLNKGGGDISVSNLNIRLMEYLNPATENNTFFVYDRQLRINDKVMQRKNDYDLDIYNGDIGFIIKNDTDNKSVLIDFSGREVLVPYSKMDNIVHNYAMTVHKAQGSEVRAVIFLATRAGCFFLLNKNLFYTAITRAKEKLIMIMPLDVVKTAIRFNVNRQSYLANRIKQLVIGREKEEDKAK